MFPIFYQFLHVLFKQRLLGEVKVDRTIIEQWLETESMLQYGQWCARLASEAATWKENRTFGNCTWRRRSPKQSGFHNYRRKHLSQVIFSGLIVRPKSHSKEVSNDWVKIKRILAAAATISNEARRINEPCYEQLSCCYSLARTQGPAAITCRIQTKRSSI